ncbi:MAG: zinc-dependent metalloprotease [Burkholderiales bacterium]|nr:zinc-dependent metalloprotease [Burkholderiales bacterium]
MEFRLSSLALAMLAIGATAGLSACATVAAPADASTATAPTAAAAQTAATAVAATGKSAASAAAAPSAPTAPGATPPAKPFADVIKGATEEAGFFTTWRKDDKVWIEIPEAMWDRPFFFSVNVTHNIGDAGLYGNHMGGFLAAGRGQFFASFKKFGANGVQLIARNVSYTAANDAPIRHAVARSFSDSLISSAQIVSAPHPEKKSVLVEANALFVNDFPMAAQQLEQTFRQPYAFDAKNSSIAQVKNSETETGFAVRGHYQLNRIALPPPIPNPSAPPARFPSTLPDMRSLFMGYYYGFSKLPAQPMRPREADPRVGYFTTSVNDFTDPDKREQRSRYINRWRLEKKDPSAAMSEPKEPIVYWLDKNIPTAYRNAVSAGILEWNKAYEKIGFKNAIVVKQQADGDDFDTSATRFASVRWVAGNNVPFGARGPSKTDPRTGEIFDADIEMNEDITRLYSARIKEDPPRPISGVGLFRNSGELCTYADNKLTEAAFALDLLVARGEFEYGSPAAESWLMDAIKDITAHEVGHTLGLRHNFKGSMAVTPEQLRDAKYGAEVGVSASVMDYNALNIATKDERQGQYSMVTVGAYDMWAIEYGYKETTPETERMELAKTLSRSNEPQLAYATDEDAGFGSIVEGIDPETNRSDLSSDPLGFYEKRFAVIREVWDRVQARQLEPGTKYETLRRHFDRGFLLMGPIAELAAKYVGGVSVRRDVAGSGRQPLTPTDAAQQRRALNLLARNVFAVDAFKFKPEFLAKLVPDFDARWDSVADDDIGVPRVAPIDSSVAGRVFAVQRATLNQLMRDSVAARVLVAPEKMADGSKALSLAELYSTLQKTIWSELDSGAPSNLMRRNLQREHVRLMAEAVARPSPRSPADARALQREFASELLASLRRAASKSGQNIETRAHLNESIALIDAALKAQIAKVLG